MIAVLTIGTSVMPHWHVFPASSTQKSIFSWFSAMLCRCNSLLGVLWTYSYSIILWFLFPATPHFLFLPFLGWVGVFFCFVPELFKAKSPKLCRWERFSFAITQSSVPYSGQVSGNNCGSAACALAVGLAPQLTYYKRVYSAEFAGCNLLLCSQQQKWRTQGQAPFLVEPK